MCLQIATALYVYLSCQYYVGVAIENFLTPQPLLHEIYVDRSEIQNKILDEIDLSEHSWYFFITGPSSIENI